MSEDGRVEIVSTEFVIGWARVGDGSPVLVTALLDGALIGYGEAALRRADLDGAVGGRAFVVLFDRPVPAGRVRDIEVRVGVAGTALPQLEGLRVDRAPPVQVFVVGSPRSGTSELGSTLAAQLGLPWLGEAQAAPSFAQAAQALAGDAASGSDLVRFLAQQDQRRVAVAAAKRAYFFLHGSASFVDKTPGVPMIQALPFVVSCFPLARIICLRRNGISNVLSRMAKFGGSFEEHCSDWAVALKEWARVREVLPHCLEIQQEEMLAAPERVADRVAAYLEVPALAGPIGASLRSGSGERTGAGLGRTTLADTGWSEREMGAFRRRCGPTMEAFGYALDDGTLAGG